MTTTQTHEPAYPAHAHTMEATASTPQVDDASDRDDAEIEWRAADEIRHKNYMALRAHFRSKEGPELPDRGALQRFSDYVGIASRYVSHIERKKKRIGRKIASHFEKAFNLPPGWLDVDREDGTLAFDPDARDFAELAMRLYLRDRDGVKNALMLYMESKINR